MPRKWWLLWRGLCRAHIFCLHGLNSGLNQWHFHQCFQSRERNTRKGKGNPSQRDWQKLSPAGSSELSSTALEEKASVVKIYVLVSVYTHTHTRMHTKFVLTPATDVHILLKNFFSSIMNVLRSFTVGVMNLGHLWAFGRCWASICWRGCLFLVFTSRTCNGVGSQNH